MVFCFVVLLGLIAAGHISKWIYRIPLVGRACLAPSACDGCGLRLRVKEQLPLVGFFLLGGKCGCRLVPLDRRYLLIEGVTVGAFALTSLYPVQIALAFCVYFLLLIPAIFIDLDWFILPDRLTLGLVLAGVLCSLAVPELHHARDWRESLEAALLGVVSGAGLLGGLWVFGYVIFRREALGVGDIKLVAGMGAFFGWQAPYYILPAGALVGAVLTITLRLIGGQRMSSPLSFGPYLALGSVLWLIDGEVPTRQFFEQFWVLFRS